MTFNYFGCVAADIVNYYHGTEVTDYSTNGISGTNVINEELAYSEQKVLEAVSLSFSLALQNGIPYVRVWDQMDLGISGVGLGAFHYAYKVDETSSTYPPIGSCSNGSCASISNLYDETTASISISGSIITITNADPNKDYYVAVSFRSTTVFGSLKRLIRDLTACRLGCQLFSRGGEDEWKSVTRACDDSTETIKAIKDDIYWMPFELKKLSYYPGTSPVRMKGGISTMKIGRS